jgi:hypothetical protein
MPKLGGRREPAAARALVEPQRPVRRLPGQQVVAPICVEIAGIQPQGAVAAPADQIDWAVAVDITPKQRQRASVASRCDLDRPRQAAAR